jgi:hypothetical protein
MKAKAKYTVTVVYTNGKPWTEFVDGKVAAMKLVRDTVELPNAALVQISKVVPK